MPQFRGSLMLQSILPEHPWKRKMKLANTTLN